MLGRGLGRLTEVVLAQTPEAPRDQLATVAFVDVVAVPLPVFWPQHLQNEHGVVQAVAEVFDREELEYFGALVEYLHDSVRGHVAPRLLHKHLREVEDKRGQDVEQIEEERVAEASPELHMRLPNDAIAWILCRAVIQRLAEVLHGQWIALS